LWIIGIVYVVPNLFLVWVITKYPHREALKATCEPELHKLELNSAAIAFGPATGIISTHH